MSPETVEHPVFARVWDWLSRKGDKTQEGEHRDEMVAGLSGRVLELGAGNGINFARYPATVEQLVAVEPERHLRGLAVLAAQRAPIPVVVEDAVAGSLPFGDGSFDAAVASLVLCSVADQPRALAELFRLIRPGGELRFYEHVVAERRPLPAVMKGADATVWPRLFGGCHCSRDTAAAIASAGFAIESCRRFTFGLPHVLGVARRP